MDSYLSVLYNTFMKDERYMLIVNGLMFTLSVTILAAIIGIILGVVLSLMTISDFRPFKHTKSKKLTFLRDFNPLNKLALFYVTVIRGTPTVVQLLILFSN